MTVSGSGSGGVLVGTLLSRFRLLKFDIAAIIRSISELPSTLPGDRKAYYEDSLSKWFARMEALKELVTSFCESEDECAELMEGLDSFIQRYDDAVEKLSKIKVTEKVTDNSALTFGSPMSPISDFVIASKSDKQNTVSIASQGYPKKLVPVEISSVTIADDFSVVFNAGPESLLGQRIYFNVQGISPSFQERGAEMKKLTSAFRSILTSPGTKSNESNSIIIHGMPGTGKTSLVSAFVNNHGEDLVEFHVLWICGGSKRCIRDQFVQACEPFLPGRTLRDKEGKLIKDDDVMREIYNHLTSNRTLIIFDNAASGVKNFGIEEAIGDFFPKATQPMKHHPIFLITTRTGAPEAWKGYNGTMFPLGSFSDEDCWTYMKKELPTLAYHKAECRRLWEFFDRLPIAIEHAVNLMTYEASFCGDEATYSPEEFVRMVLEFQPVSRENFKGMDLYEKLNCMYAYSMELLKNVPDVGVIAIHVLDVMAVLSSTGIPDKFLLQILKGYIFPENARFDTIYKHVSESMEGLFEMVIGFLRKFSIVQKTSQLVYVHELVQENRLRCLKRDSRLDGHVGAIVESMIAAPTLTSYQEKEYALNFKNIEQVCDAILKYTQDDHTELKIRCARYIKDCLPQIGLDLLRTSNDTVETFELKSRCHSNLRNYSQALLYIKHVCDTIGVNLGKEHPHLLSIKTNKSMCLYDLSKSEEACQLSNEVYDPNHHIIGKGHPDTMIDKTKTPNMHSSSLGNFKKILRLSKEVYDSCFRTQGEENLHTLSIKNQLANRHSDIGNHVEALRLSKEVYDTCRRALGEEHPKTLAIKNNMTMFHLELGNFAEAHRLCKVVYESSCLILGEEHQYSLAIKNNMAKFLSDLGNSAEALQLTKEVYDSCSHSLGEEHPTTLSIKNNMANRHSDLGNYAEALRLSTEVLDSRCRILGNEHPATLSIKSNMSTFHSDLGNYTEALHLSQEVYESIRRILGEDHPDTLSIKNNIATFHSDLGDYAEALQLSKEVYHSRCRILGEEHPHTLNTINNLATFHSDVGNYAEALRLCEEAYETSCRVLGEEHPDTLSIKNNMSVFHSDLRNHSEALRLSREVYDSSCRILGGEHLATLSIKNNMSTFHQGLGNYREALRLSNQVYNSRSCILGPDHPDTLCVKNNMAQLQWELGYCEEALTSSKTLCDVLTSKYGERHPLTIMAQKTLRRIRVSAI